MAASFLHGVEVIEVQRGARPVRVVKSAVVGVVGTAPLFDVAAADRTVGVPVLVSSEREAERLFGRERAGFSIPQALSALFDHGAALAIVVNAYDPAEHDEAVQGEEHTFGADDLLALGRVGVSSLVLTGPIQRLYVAGVDYVVEPVTGLLLRVASGRIPLAGAVEVVQAAQFSVGGQIALGYHSNLEVANAAGTVIYDLDADYTVQNGTVIHRVAEGRIEAEATVRLTFRSNFSADQVDIAPVVGSLVVRSPAGTLLPLQAGVDYELDAGSGVVRRLTTGALPAEATVTASYSCADPDAVTANEIIGTVVDGRRSGIKALLDAGALFGFRPKLLIAPGYSQETAVAAELVSVAARVRGLALLDAPAGQTVSQAIAARGGDAAFATSSGRAVLCYPALKVLDAATGLERAEPYSSRLAGAIAARDLAEGYWWSPSNVELRGVIGQERPISAELSDSTCEANLLNEAGIVTLFNAWGTGRRVWGNRTAAWPSATGPETFIPVQRTADVLHESVEQAMLQFMDRPLGEPYFDAVTESVNEFIRTLIGRGALVGGSCTFDPGANPPTALALGHVVFDLEFMPPPPAERVTFQSRLNINLLTASED